MRYLILLTCAMLLLIFLLTIGKFIVIFTVNMKYLNMCIHIPNSLTIPADQFHFIVD
jgi:hypothetical protein